MTKVLESLTAEQEALLPQYRDKWIANCMASTPPDFYSDKIKERIKDIIIGHYSAAKKKIQRDNIIFAPSPIIAPFIGAAYLVGKKGTPKKPVKWKGDAKLSGMDAVEDFINQHTNPREIIKAASKVWSCQYWGMPIAGSCGFVEFFKKETDAQIGIDESIIKNMIDHTMLAHCSLMMDNLCVVALRPVTIRHNNGAAIDDGKPYIVWADGIGLTA